MNDKVDPKVEFIKSIIGTWYEKDGTKSYQFNTDKFGVRQIWLEDTLKPTIHKAGSFNVDYQNGEYCLSFDNGRFDSFIFEGEIHTALLHIRNSIEPAVVVIKPIPRPD